MNKQELIAKIAKDTGSSKAGAAAAVDSMIDGITRSLKKGDSITFVGFGTFKTAQRKARTARNPQTGAAIKIPKAPRRPLQRGQSPEGTRSLDANAGQRAKVKGQGQVDLRPLRSTFDLRPPPCTSPLTFALCLLTFCYTERSFLA